MDRTLKALGQISRLGLKAKVYLESNFNNVLIPLTNLEVAKAGKDGFLLVLRWF